MLHRIAIRLWVQWYEGSWRWHLKSKSGFLPNVPWVLGVSICTIYLTLCATQINCKCVLGSSYHLDGCIIVMAPRHGNAFSTSGPRFNIKMTSYWYRKSHCGDKTVVRSSYLHNGISYTGKMTSLYWIRALFLCQLWCSYDVIVMWPVDITGYISYY